MCSINEESLYKSSIADSDLRSQDTVALELNIHEVECEGNIASQAKLCDFTVILSF